MLNDLRNVYIPSDAFCKYSKVLTHLFGLVLISLSLSQTHILVFSVCDVSSFCKIKEIIKQN